jgi:hypothetical protein
MRLTVSVATANTRKLVKANLALLLDAAAPAGLFAVAIAAAAAAIT